MLSNISNKEALKIKRISIITDGWVAGQKYYLPENPDIDALHVVGIEAHIQQDAIIGDIGDLTQAPGNNNEPPILNAGNYAGIFLTIIDEDNNEKFNLIPLLSIYQWQGNINPPFFKKIVKGYFGKIKTKNSYFTLAPGYTFSGNTITLTFYTR